jgi:hypothetical protein
LASNGTFVLWCKDYENAIRALITLLIDDEFLGRFHGKAKAFERLNKYEEAIESRTIELDDATSYALLRIGKCHEKLGNKVLALNFTMKLFMKILFWIKDGLPLPILFVKKTIKSIILCQ